jgi:hypothetical protein
MHKPVDTPLSERDERDLLQAQALISRVLHSHSIAVQNAELNAAVEEPQLPTDGGGK